MDKTRTFLYKAQSNWIKISSVMMGCQKISSTTVEEQNKASISFNNNSEKNCLKFSSTNSRICAKQYWSEAESQWNAEYWNLKKVYKREHLLVLHTRRFYWPGSYALRGVIVQCMLKMGAPLFVELYLYGRLDANIGISISLSSFWSQKQVINPTEDVPVSNY